MRLDCAAACRTLERLELRPRLALPWIRRPGRPGWTCVLPGWTSPGWDGSMYFDRSDICQAYYVFAMLWHGGQRCPIYRYFGRLERLRFRPSPLLGGPEDLEDNARSIYDQLCQRHGLNQDPE